MSYSLVDPDEYEDVYEYSTCPFHQAYPGVPNAMCTCSASHSQRRRPPEEIARLRAERIRKEEDAILARAEAIKARRRSEASNAD